MGFSTNLPMLLLVYVIFQEQNPNSQDVFKIILRKCLTQNFYGDGSNKQKTQSQYPRFCESMVRETSWYFKVK